MKMTEYGEVINCKKTYETIAFVLKSENSILIGWTDEEHTHYDILFTYKAMKHPSNYVQHGLRWNDLFVSIIGRGAFGFKTHREKSASYIGEKLNLGVNETTEKLTELINGVIKELEV